MRKLLVVLLLLGVSAPAAFARSRGPVKSLLIEDFETEVSGGTEGSVDFGAGNGSAVEVAAEPDLSHSGKQSLKVSFAVVPGGYIYVAKGGGLDAKNARWEVDPASISWDTYASISFYMYGSNSKTRIAFDIKDTGNELWRFLIDDNFKGWKKMICPFKDFFVRGDWQPQNADANAVLDFPLQSFQFEPLPKAKGILYFDTVELNPFTGALWEDKE
jgi:hypothetical protein